MAELLYIAAYTILLCVSVDIGAALGHPVSAGAWYTAGVIAFAIYRKKWLLILMAADLLIIGLWLVAMGVRYYFTTTY